VRHRQSVMSWPFSAIVLLAFGLPSVVAESVGRDATLETVLRGMQAREDAARAKLDSFAGSWQVEMASRQPPKSIPGQSADPAARASTPLKRAIWRVDTLVSGERYRETVRVSDPPGVHVKGYNGTDAWELDYSPSAKAEVQPRTAGMIPVGSLFGAELCGLTYIVDPDSKSRLSQWVRQGQPRLLGEETIDGRKCFRLQFRVSASSSVTDEMWLCPDYGYAMVRWQHGTRNRVWLYSDFRQFGDIWMPQTYSLTSESEIPGKGWLLVASTRARLLTFNLGPKASPGSFAPPKKGATK
jgi:hypothetical protein